MYQSGRAGDEAKKWKSPAKSRRVGITEIALSFLSDGKYNKKILKSRTDFTLIVERKLLL